MGRYIMISLTFPNKTLPVMAKSCTKADIKVHWFCPILLNFSNLFQTICLTLPGFFHKSGHVWSRYVILSRSCKILISKLSLDILLLTFKVIRFIWIKLMGKKHYFTIFFQIRWKLAAKLLCKSWINNKYLHFYVW